MKDRITINGRNGAFGAYIARPVGGCARQRADERFSKSATAMNRDRFLAFGRCLDGLTNLSAEI
jgi:hypothetical protein